MRECSHIIHLAPYLNQKLKNASGPIDIARVSSKMNKDKLNVVIGGISEINLRLKQNKFNMAAICDVSIMIQKKLK